MMTSAVSLIASLCLSQPKSCSPNMWRCYNKIVREITSCEKHFELSGPTWKQMRASDPCVQTWEDWHHTTEADKVNYCAVYFVEDPFPLVSP